jgi:hypothetical protein
MAIDEKYVTLLSSLPVHGALFSEKKTPLSRISLNQRLKQLQPEHQAILKNIEETFNWDKLPLSLTNTLFITTHKKLKLPLSEDVQVLLDDKINLRTVIGALRYRHYRSSESDRESDRESNGKAKSLSGNWTNSRLKSRIENHWSEPTFKLETVYPWLQEALDLIKQERILALEKLILKSAWELIDSHQDYQPFSFKSVIIYVLKWNIVDRWTRYDSYTAIQRYQHIIKNSKPDLSGVMN